MFMFFKIFILSLFISMVIIKLSMFLSMKMKLNLEKMSPFECGFNPIYYKRMPFSIRFFLITVIFLIFDIEIALMMPMIMCMMFSNIMIWIYSSTIFILILIMGLFYEWKNGALDWI